MVNSGEFGMWAQIQRSIPYVCRVTASMLHKPILTVIFNDELGYFSDAVILMPIDDRKSSMHGPND